MGRQGPNLTPLGSSVLASESEWDGSELTSEDLSLASKGPHRKVDLTKITKKPAAAVMKPRRHDTLAADTLS
jgi:hypothetical protein